MVDGFLGRWSQRKQAARAARQVDQPSAKPLPARDAGLAREHDATPTPTPTGPLPTAMPAVDAAAAAEAAPLSMQDVASLDSESDFKPFVARAVAPEVRNAALKKLFADPHFNLMDGLDTYIDDYSKPDPLPLAMMRKMASAKFLNLFEDDADKAASAAADAPAAQPAQTVAQSDQPHHAEPGSEAPSPDPTATDHDDTDMRLQPDHAAGPASPGRGVG